MNEIDAGKRLLIRGGALLALLAALPKAVLAAAWPAGAFKATEADAALDTLLAGETVTPSEQIELTTPEIAENGAVVPISVSTTLKEVQSISIVVENNPRPLAANFEIPPGTLPEIASRIKMGETSDVIAVVKTANGTFSTKRMVKVTIGGCGG
jgi:sulfur-oxidizing protein SoxY